MPLFRRQDTQRERTPAEREYARRVRDARRRGLPDPPLPPELADHDDGGWAEADGNGNGHHAAPVEPEWRGVEQEAHEPAEAEWAEPAPEAAWEQPEPEAPQPEPEAEAPPVEPAVPAPEPAAAPEPPPAPEPVAQEPEPPEPEPAPPSTVDQPTVEWSTLEGRPPASAQPTPPDADPWDAPPLEPPAAAPQPAAEAPSPEPAAETPAPAEEPDDPQDAESNLPPIVTPLPPAPRRRTVRLIPSGSPQSGLPPVPGRSSSSSTAGFPAIRERRGLLGRLRDRREDGDGAAPDDAQDAGRRSEERRPPAIPPAPRRGTPHPSGGEDETRERLLARLGEREDPKSPSAPAAVPPMDPPPRRRLSRAQRPDAAPAAAAGGARPRRRILSRLVALVVLIVLVAAVIFAWLLFQPFAGSGSGRVQVTIPAGASTSRIADVLARRGVIAHPFFFELRAKIDGKRGQFKAGTFQLRHGMSYAAALSALTTQTGAAPSVNVTIPEGKARKEMAPLLRQAGVKGDYLAASQSSPLLSPKAYGGPRGASLEGFLFPSTYELPRKRATAQELVTEQLKSFKQNFAKVNLARARRAHLTGFDVVTIASMVEREAAVQRDRPLIAAVIWNRLRLGMPLGIDATLRYALNDWDKPLLESQLKNPTPYNTRLHQGLPPGPIGNPGLASLQAAANPAHVNYLYYVVKPGTDQHVFSSTYAQFQRDVQRYQSARAANGGKSPTK